MDTKTIEQDINNFYIESTGFDYLDVKALVKWTKEYNINLSELVNATKDVCPDEKLTDLNTYFETLFILRLQQFIDYTHDALIIEKTDKLEKLLIYLYSDEARNKIYTDCLDSGFNCEILKKLNDNVFSIDDLLLLEKKKDFIID